MPLFMNLTMATSIEMMIYVSIICFHIKTHHIGKFEETLRPCANSLHYRMLHDYRELILISEIMINLNFLNY